MTGVPLPPVKDEEIEAVLTIFRRYGNPLGASGVLLGTAVVTRSNERRIRFVVAEMEKRGLLSVKYPARFADDDDLYVIADA